MYDSVYLYVRVLLCEREGGCVCVDGICVSVCVCARVSTSLTEFIF